MVDDDEGTVNFYPGHVLEESDGLSCFAVDLRVCGPACMAYVTHPMVTKNPELNEQQRHCALLVSVERLSRSATVLASTLGSVLKQQKTAAADAERKENTPAPRPFGTPPSTP